MSRVNLMAYAISLYFDPRTDQTVRALWRSVEETGISSFLSQGPFHPHLTLAIYEQIDTTPFCAALTDLASDQPPLPVALPSIGAFPGEEGVVFLSMTMTEALLILHRRIHDLLDRYGRNPVPYYLPDRWTPHCSIARALTPDQVTSVVALCRSLIPDTLHGSLIQFGVIQTPEEVELCRFDLNGKSY